MVRHCLVLVLLLFDGVTTLLLFDGVTTLLVPTRSQLVVGVVIQ